MRLDETAVEAYRQASAQAEATFGCSGDRLVAALARALDESQVALRKTRVRLGDATTKLGLLRRQHQRLAGLLVHAGLLDEADAS